MTDYKKYINALRQCAKEHKNDSTPFAHIIASDLCCDVANLLERLEQEPCDDCVSREELLKIFGNRFMELQKLKHIKGNESLKDEQLGVNWCTNTLKELPSVKPTSNLDKIKAEIRKGKYAEKKGLPERSLIYANGWDDGLEVAISIIDKYKE